MKFLFLILLSITTLQIQGCKKDTDKVDSNTLVGTWKLIGEYMGLPDGYVEIEDGELFIFNRDSTFIKGTGKCTEGHYSISDKHITLNFSCDIKDTMLSDGIQKWSYSLENGILQMSPTFLNCPEGCSRKYKKISNN